MFDNNNYRAYLYSMCIDVSPRNALLNNACVRRNTWPVVWACDEYATSGNHTPATRRRFCVGCIIARTLNTPMTTIFRRRISHTTRKSSLCKPAQCHTAPWSNWWARERHRLHRSLQLRPRNVNGWEREPRQNLKWVPSPRGGVEFPGRAPHAFYIIPPAIRSIWRGCVRIILYHVPPHVPLRSCIQRERHTHTRAPRLSLRQPFNPAHAQSPSAINLYTHISRASSTTSVLASKESKNSKFKNSFQKF